MECDTCHIPGGAAGGGGGGAPPVCFDDFIFDSPTPTIMRAAKNVNNQFYVFYLIKKTKIGNF